jgi:hypothetical protein
VGRSGGGAGVLRVRRPERRIPCPGEAVGNSPPGH